jgi:hypothetical protein
MSTKSIYEYEILSVIKDNDELTPCRVEYHDKEPDKYGRRSFMLYWMADYHPGDPQGEYRRAERGQVHVSIPEEIFRRRTDEVIALLKD